MQHTKFRINIKYLLMRSLGEGLNRYGIALLLCIYLCLLFPANSTANDSNSFFKVNLITGISTDNLNWSIAGVGDDPVNILSELTFNDIKVYHYGLGATFSICGFFIQPEIIKGYIYKGWATDSDYSMDNRKSLTFKSEMDVKDNDAKYINLTFGYNYKVEGKNFSFAPVVGYSKRKQELIITGGNVLFPEKRPIYGLNSKYATDWQGFFAGIRSQYLFQSAVNINAFFHFHYLEYAAVADWNLREDFSHPVSFRHSGYGKGMEWGVGIGYSIGNLNLELGYKYKFFKINNGRDELYFSTGETVRSNLNEVEWQSDSFTFKISYTFEGA